MAEIILDVNITNNGRQTRRISGIIMLILGVTWSYFVILSDYDVLITSSVFIFYMSGFLLVIEARNSVCILNAARNKDGKTGLISIIGQEDIKDNLRNKIIRQIAVKEVFHAIVLGSIVTTIILVIQLII